MLDYTRNKKLFWKPFIVIIITNTRAFLMSSINL